MDLKTLEGRWYINQSDFPMWLKGDKTSPTFNFKIIQKQGKDALDDAVMYWKNGKEKSILGIDTALNQENTAFLWRGKGWLSLVTSKWNLLHFNPQQQWAIIGFSKTLFTPKGYDVISRQKELSSEQIASIEQQLKQLQITSPLRHIQQE